MKNLFEAKNFNLPANFLIVFAYVLGLALSKSYSYLFITVAFAMVIFIFNFDDKIRNAVLQANALAILSIIISEALSVLYHFSQMAPKNSDEFIFGAYSNGTNFLLVTYNFLSNTWNVIVLILFLIFIFANIFGNGIQIGFFSNLFYEKAPKVQQQYQQMPQQNQPMQQPVQPMQQPVQPMQQPTQPQQQQPPQQ